MKLIKKIITNNYIIFSFTIIISVIITMIIVHYSKNFLYNLFNFHFNFKLYQNIYYITLYLMINNIIYFNLTFLNKNIIYDELCISIRNGFKNEKFLKKIICFDIYTTKIIKYEFKNKIDFYLTFKKKIKNITKEDYLLFIINKKLIDINDLNINNKKLILKKLRNEKIKSIC
jgi:hypothetical protein